MRPPARPRGPAINTQQASSFMAAADDVDGANDVALRQGHYVGWAMQEGARRRQLELADACDREPAEKRYAAF